MITVNEAVQKLHKGIGAKGRLAFFSAFIAGILTHLSALTSNFPNHDGLASEYFDQNMITSGRWFLGTACGISSFYSLPWLIGLLSVVYIAVAAMVVRAILNIESPVYIVLASVVLAVFPGLASNFAYVFTMDGYMLGMLLCVLSVWAVDTGKRTGWIAGAILLAFGMGCYQSYVCIAMLLCIFKIAQNLMGAAGLTEAYGKGAKNSSKKTDSKGKVFWWNAIFKYAAMGAVGVALYYILLRVLLIIQGKELDTYQGINGMSESNGIGLLGTVKLMYGDFFRFTFGKVFTANIFAATALALLTVVALIAFFKASKPFVKKPLFYVVLILALVVLPCVMNAILFISAEVTYHVLMRYQWAFLIVCLVAVADGFLEKKKNGAEAENSSKPGKADGALSGNLNTVMGWVGALSLVIISLSYIVNDNIAYSNLNKKYEKTYAYCLRLADRIEQTPGYYQGIPVALVGVVGQDSFPKTDITDDVTAGLLGVEGDYLLYKSENYGDFFKHYLGITLNIVSSDEVANFYNEDFYAEMESFPGETSVLLHDGIIYVKTENIR